MIRMLVTLIEKDDREIDISWSVYTEAHAQGSPVELAVANDVNAALADLEATLKSQ